LGLLHLPHQLPLLDPLLLSGRLLQLLPLLLLPLGLSHPRGLSDPLLPSDLLARLHPLDRWLLLDL